jgi:hypothetical protein
MEFESSFIHLCIKDGILVGTYKNNVHIDLEVAKQIVLTRIRFTGGKNMPSIIRSEGIVSIAKPAREYLASEEGTRGLLAAAIIVNSPFSQVLGNFFLEVNKTKLPVKIFTNVSRAEAWLKQFVV